jgi:uncharacterized protein
LITALSNCPHPLDPALLYTPGHVEIAVFRLDAAGGEFERNATAEAKRAFENTHAYLSMQGAHERV